MRKIFYGILANFGLTFFTFFYVSYLLNVPYNFYNFLVIISVRQLVSFVCFNDYNLSWSKSSINTAYIKLFSNSISFIIYFLIFRIFEVNIPFNILIFELSTFLIVISFCIYTYRFFKISTKYFKKNSVIIYGAGRAGINLQNELIDSKVLFFIDEDKKLHYRSVDGIKIISPENVIEKNQNLTDTTLIIALPSASSKKKTRIYNKFKLLVNEIKFLPPVDEILKEKPFSKQLKNISILDLLARNPKDLDKNLISKFIKDRIILITGSSGSIGSELLKISIKNKAKEIIAIDHNEFGQYGILEKEYNKVKTYVISVLNKDSISEIFKKHKPDIVLHAAAYKHVHLSEYSISSTIKNNIIGTRNVVDLSILNNVKKFVLISTDKAVNPTNIMGASKSVCELYCQNIESNGTDIISVRFGNVLGSSGSVIPKFQSQINNDLDITVTHKDITRYFMLVTEACNLVFQAASIGKNSDILILKMGNPIKISELAQKMIDLSGKYYLKIKYTGLRKGEKLYEELLFSDKDKKTEYESITVAKRRKVKFHELNKMIQKLIEVPESEKINILKKILPDFNHMRDN